MNQPEDSVVFSQTHLGRIYQQCQTRDFTQVQVDLELLCVELTTLADGLDRIIDSQRELVSYLREQELQHISKEED